jgi:hypothetical protein
VFTIECTQKLLDRLDRLPSAADADPSTRLGDWCANIVALGGRKSSCW